jgi:hypothetical protein
MVDETEETIDVTTCIYDNEGYIEILKKQFDFMYNFT